MDIFLSLLNVNSVLRLGKFLCVIENDQLTIERMQLHKKTSAMKNKSVNYFLPVDAFCFDNLQMPQGKGNSQVVCEVKSKRCKKKLKRVKKQKLLVLATKRQCLLLSLPAFLTGSCFLSLVHLEAVMRLLLRQHLYRIPQGMELRLRPYVCGHPSTLQLYLYYRSGLKRFRKVRLNDSHLHTSQRKYSSFNRPLSSCFRLVIVYRMHFNMGPLKSYSCCFCFGIALWA